MASVLHPTDSPPPPGPEDQGEFDAATREKIERAAEEKRRARAEPGASWNDWLYFQAFKWWIIIAYLVVDSWIAAEWVVLGSALGLGLSLIAAAYFEYLLFEYLWYRPDPDAPRLRPGEFRPTWYKPVPLGRWTPEAALQRRGIPLGEEPGQVDPKEFL